MIKNKLFWFGITMFVGGLEILFHFIDHSKGTKLNFGDGQEYMGLFFIIAGGVSLGIDFFIKKAAKEKSKKE